MDVGTFKASRLRLVMWVVIPPLLILGGGGSSFALRRLSEWRLNRVRLLANVLPKLTQTQRDSESLLSGFRGADATSIQSEDELISFIHETALKTGFTVDSLKVDRLGSTAIKSLPVLKAKVTGEGTFAIIQSFLSGTVTSQYLLSGTSLQLSQRMGRDGSSVYQADVTFELVLCDSLGTQGGASW